MCSCLQCPQLSEPECVLLRALSGAFCRSHRHSVCLVGRVDLMCSCTAGGKVWVFFLSHSAPGFQLWFYSHLYMWVGHWGLLLRLPCRTWVCPCEGRCAGGAAAWVAAVLAAPGTQGRWWLGQQDIYCSRRVWQPVLANTLQHSCLESPLSCREAWKVTQSLQHRVAKSQTRPK